MGHVVDVLLAASVGALVMYVVCWVTTGRLRDELARLTNRAAYAEAVVTKVQDEAEASISYLSHQVHALQFRLEKLQQDDMGECMQCKKPLHWKESVTYTDRLCCDVCYVRDMEEAMQFLRPEKGTADNADPF